MSSDYFGEDEELDSADLANLDAIEAAHSHSHHLQSLPSVSGYPNPSTTPAIAYPIPLTSTSSLASHKPAPLSTLPPKPSSAPVSVIDVDADDSFDGIFDDIDPADLERLDKDVEHVYEHGNNPLSSNVASRSDGTRQLTLFGEPLPNPPPRSQGHSQQTGQPKQAIRNPFGQKLRKTKKWDHTAFARSGWKSGTTVKGKNKANDMNVDEDVDEEHSATEEFEQFPAPTDQQKYSFAPPPSCSKLAPDMLAVKSWIFPTNRPKRDYQFNIIRESLFENTIVAVPTGLGKTFIAGVIMLNYYRWFPEGKVVFVAPTKPLVAQQIEACHQTCGIPGGDAAELTGQTTRPNRAKAWAEKRVFYMTPQTLMNDLKTDNCDPTDIILLVIDEAHKATGDYAYAQVVRYLMAKNAHFRILALSATPGANAEKVQAIVDSLHISHIELRDERSIDVRPYIHPKEILTYIVKMSEDVIRVRDLLARVMDKTAQRLIASGLIPGYNAVTLHPFRCTSLITQYTRDGTSKNFSWFYTPMKKLSSLARAMTYLLECSIVLCHQTVQEMIANDADKTASNGFRSDPLFQDLIKELERQHNAGFAFHPKLDKLQRIAVDHFVSATADASEAAAKPAQDLKDEVQLTNGDTKMMVFTNFRASVGEIVKVLNMHRPMIRATPFVGQGTDRNGGKGMAQKEQLETIQKFKDGIYNVLVATSIGEEGLDIGEVDMIICYDAQKTPIRTLQRMGRTGRKRAGKIAVLMTENREESNWRKAQQEYESVQTHITRGHSLELFCDVDRLLPEHVKPKCLEMHMAIEEYTRDTKRSKSQTLPTGIKRKRNADIHRNVPEGASTGFIPSSRLIPKGASKKRKVAKEYDLDDVEDDEDDLAMQAGIFATLPIKDKATITKGKVPKKKAAKKLGTSTCRKKNSVPFQSVKISESLLTQPVEDSAEDIEIQKGVEFSSPECPWARSSVLKVRSSPSLSNPIVVSPPACPTVLSKRAESPHSWLLNSDSDVEIVEDVSPLPFDLIKGSKVGKTPPKTPEKREFKRSPLSHVPMEKVKIMRHEELPSPILSCVRMSSDASSDVSFSIRAPGVRRKHIKSEPASSSSAKQLLFQTQSSLPSPSPPRKATRRAKPVDHSKAEIWLDIEAEVSGDDAPGGSSDTEGVESESDRRFVQELEATQASPSYDQTIAYRKSLFTQAPGTENGPHFSTKPVRRGAFGIDKQSTMRHISVSPVKDGAPDQYSMDSFVVEDDDDIIIQDYDHSSGL